MQDLERNQAKRRRVMSNPLMSMIGGMGGGNNPMAAMMQAMQVVNQIRQSGNPQAALNAMAQQNPNIFPADAGVNPVL